MMKKGYWTKLTDWLTNKLNIDNYLAILSASAWCKFDETCAGGGGVGKGNKLGRTGGSRHVISWGVVVLTGRLIPKAANAAFEAPSLAVFLLEPTKYTWA